MQLGLGWIFVGAHAVENRRLIQIAVLGASSLYDTTIHQHVQAGRTKKRNLDETLVLNRISTSRHLATAHVHCTYVTRVYQASNVTDNRPLLRESPKTVISLLFRHLL